MKRSLFGLTTAALLAGTAHAATVLDEDFEDATVTYTTSQPEFSDGFGDFLTRTDGTNVGTFYEISNVQDNSWFAAMDIDGSPGIENPSTMDFAGLDIAGLTGLEFSIFLAEDDDGSNNDWDDVDSVHIDYRIDGGAFQNLLWIENDGSQFNSAPFIDTDFDGTGDGDEITNVLTQYNASIGGTGSTLDLRITFSLGSGDEDISIDNVLITGVPEPGSLALLALGGLAMIRRRRA